MSETLSRSYSQAFLLWLGSQGYQDAKLIRGGKYYVAIYRMNFTHAILLGRVGDYASYDDRWCYCSYDAAKTALAAWDGTTEEPIGWKRHPRTGRRVAETLTEVDDLGHLVEIGAPYVRR